MTTPPAPPAGPPAPPAAGPQPGPGPGPAPAPPAPAGPPPAPPSPNGDELAQLKQALEAERRDRAEVQKQLDQLKQQGMTDAEKAIQAAKAEGRAEAAAEHAKALAAAEFRAQAAGKLANPEAALAALDLARLVKDGQPDTKAIGQLVEQLAAVPPAPGHVPPGPRPPGNTADRDWLREISGGSR